MSTQPLNRVRINPGQTKDSLKIIDLNLADCQLNPNQPRKHFNEEALQDLAASIERHGLLQPVTVMRNKRGKAGFTLVAGERRYRAYQTLGKTTIPAVVTSGNPDEIALIENLQREDLNPLEEAQALARLKTKYSYNHEELGQAVGKARSTITNLLKLNDLPSKIKKESSTSNLVNKSVLIELSKLSNTKEQMKLWKEIKENGATVRQARAKKQGEAKELSNSQRTLSNGKRFVSELEKIAVSDKPLEPEAYEELLSIFKRFIEVIDNQALRQSE